MKQVSAAEGGSCSRIMAYNSDFVTNGARMSRKYAYYGKGIGRRDHRHTPLQDGQRVDRNSCCHIVAYHLQANRRIRMSL